MSLSKQLTSVTLYLPLCLSLSLSLSTGVRMWCERVYSLESELVSACGTYFLLLLQLQLFVYISCAGNAAKRKLQKLQG